MVTRYFADGRQQQQQQQQQRQPPPPPPPPHQHQQADRVPTVSLPSIHSLNLGTDVDREAPSPFGARAFGGSAAQHPPYPHARADVPHLSPAQAHPAYLPRLASDSFEYRDRMVVDSAAPSPTQRAINSPASPAFAVPQIKEECSRCNTSLGPGQAECCCGNVRFIHPFQPHSRHLAAGLDDAFHPVAMSRRGSAARSSFDSLSCGSNPPSRRGSCVTNAGVAKSTPRRKSTVTSRRRSTQKDPAQKQNKAEREKGSRRALRKEHKKLEIHQEVRGWVATTDLNSNNQKNSSLKGKKLEILQQTNASARQGDLRTLGLYEAQRRLVHIARKGAAERMAEDVAFLMETDREAEEASRALRTWMAKEDVAVSQYMDEEDRKEANERAQGHPNGRYPTPGSSSNSPSPDPTFPPFH